MILTGKSIDTPKFAQHLRARAIDIPAQRVLISRLAGSGQEVDISDPTNCNGYGRVRHFRKLTTLGWPVNPLPIDPACKALRIEPVPEMMHAQVFQNAACAWRCWYCFVPDDLLKADTSRSDWLNSDELVELYHDEPARPLILDLSGGSPDLVPEWTPWMMRSLIKRGLDKSTYLWNDDNLSTTYLFDHLEAADLRLLQEYKNYGRVCCFKGYDERSFAFNTRAAETDFSKQFEIMQRLLALEIDLYGYVTLTSPISNGIAARVSDFVDRLQSLNVNLPLRLVPLQIRMFSPVNARIKAHRERQRSLDIQEEAIMAWTYEIERRFDPSLRGRRISDVPLFSL